MNKTRILIIILFLITMLSCSQDPTSQASAFIFNQETLDKVGIQGWIIIFMVIVFAFSPFINRIIDKKSDARWQKSMKELTDSLTKNQTDNNERIVDAMSKLASLINNVENNQIALYEKITKRTISIQQAEIILNNVFYKHINEKINWLRFKYQDLDLKTCDYDLEQRLNDDKLKSITRNEVGDLNNFIVEISGNKHIVLGDNFWSLIDWVNFSPKVTKIMHDKNLSLESRINQVRDLMESYISEIKIKIFKKES